MGIRLIDAAVINHVYPIFAGSRSLIQLGRQSVLFSKNQILNLPLGDDARYRAKSIQHDGPLSDTEFFSINGFVDVKSMDVDGYENADYIYDMNDDDLPDHLREKFDFVLDGGTMEHVFHVPNFLRNIFSLLKPNGVICHMNPMNGYIDHGFYQFSPTFFRDYYSANDWEEAGVFLISEINMTSGSYNVRKYEKDIYRNSNREIISKDYGSCSGVSLFRKREDSTTGRAPTQTFYRNMHSSDAKPTN